MQNQAGKQREDLSGTPAVSQEKSEKVAQMRPGRKKEAGGDANNSSRDTHFFPQVEKHRPRTLGSPRITKPEQRLDSTQYPKANIPAMFP